jgi:hypothetical protein
MTTELDYKMSIADTLERNGGSRFTKNPSEVYLKAIRALEELQEKEHNAERAYADFESVRREQLWRESLTPLSEPWIDVLVDLIKQEGDEEKAIYHEANTPKGFDHTSMWIGKNEKQSPCLFTQPYGLEWKSICNIVDFCRRHDLQANIDAKFSWHFPGSTLGLRIQPLPR